MLSLLNEDVWIKGRGECSDLDLALLIELSLYSLVALVAVLLLELLDLRHRSCFIEELNLVLSLLSEIRDCLPRWSRDGHLTLLCWSHRVH